MSEKNLKKTIKSICIITAGWVCIILGVAGLFLPILQGILLLLLGLLLLAKRYKWARRLLEKLRRRYPHFFYRAHGYVHKVKRFLKNIFKRG